MSNLSYLEDSSIYEVENAVLEAIDEGLMDDSEIVDWVMSRISFEITEDDIINVLDRIESGLSDDLESV